MATQQEATGKTHGHKDMGTTPLSIAELSKHEAHMTPGVDPLTQGGILWNATHQPIGFVKPANFRALPDQLSTSDVVPLPNALKQGTDPRTVGMELELVYLDSNGNLMDAQEIRQTHGFSMEFARSMAEANLAHHESPINRATTLVTTLQTMASAARAHGGNIHPFSNLETPLQRDQITDHPYIDSIVARIGFETLQDFTATGIHLHKEWVDPEVALDAINRAEIIFAPLLLALSSDAPFARSSTQPNMGEIFSSEDPSRVSPEIFKALSHEGEWHTTRYATRVLGSPKAGTLPEPLLTTLAEFYREADEALQRGETVSVARTKQHHGNFRYRPEYGTIEVCLPDKAGLHITRIMAMQEFVQSALLHIEAVLANGQIETYAQRYPILFSSASVTKEQLQLAQLSNIEVAKHGVQAQVHGADGKLYQLPEAMSQMLRFLHEVMVIDMSNGTLYTEPLSQLATDVINHTVTVVPQETFDHFRDIPVEQDGEVIGFAVSPRGYYQFDSYGTSSQWINATARSMQELGLPESDIIRRTIAIYSEAADEHITGYDLDKLIELLQAGIPARRGRG